MQQPLQNTGPKEITEAAPQNNVLQADLLTMDASTFIEFLESGPKLPPGPSPSQENAREKTAQKQPTRQKPRSPPAPKQPRKFLLPTPSTLVWRAGCIPPPEATGALFLNQQPASKSPSCPQSPVEKRRHAHSSKRSVNSSDTSRPAHPAVGVLVDLN